MKGWENVVANDGVTVAIAGIVIVFAALAVISTFIYLLPSAMALLGHIAPEQQEPRAPAQPPSATEVSQDAAIAAAIGYAIYLEKQKTK